MAGVKRILRDDISGITEDDDPWKILVNPAQPSKRRKLTSNEPAQPYVYEQNLDEFDSRLNFRYSVTLWDDLVDWKKRGKGPDKFKTFDKVDCEDLPVPAPFGFDKSDKPHYTRMLTQYVYLDSELVIQVGDIVYVNFGDSGGVRIPPQESKKVALAPEEGGAKDDSNGSEGRGSKITKESAIEQDSIPDWVAKVLECRAFDEEHVFLRVLWLYRPEDLPGGRKPWHGWNEVFPSNHMQIIDAMTVTGLAGGLTRWNEKDSRTLLAQEDEGLVWRQTAKIQTQAGRIVPKLLGKLSTYCKCKQPANPDGTLIECKGCEHWMHDTCIETELAREYKSETQKNEAGADDAESAPPTEVENDGVEVEDEEKPAKSTHFNPITGAVKMITNQLKRAGKAVEASSPGQTLLEHVEKALELPTVPSSSTYTATIVGLDAEQSEGPLKVEIKEQKDGEQGDGRTVGWKKIRCLFCDQEIE